MASPYFTIRVHTGSFSIVFRDTLHHSISTDMPTRYIFRHLLILCLLPTVGVQAQTFPVLVTDTLFIQYFQQNIVGEMLPAPSGADQQWVNFDGDGTPSYCRSNGATPAAWYWESDLGGNPGNFALTSCSYVDGEKSADYPCANWLILPPVYIPNDQCNLYWKSLSITGPAFLDGYQVLISTGSNDPLPENFSDTLFSAASMISCAPGNDLCSTLSLDDYSFTPGYIHADGFTLPQYCVQEYLGGGIYTYRGKMEPHHVSLASYAGQTVYIAFLHDANNNYLLQLDDIVVVEEEVTGNQQPLARAAEMQIHPNPASGNARLAWNTPVPNALIRVFNSTGQLYFQKMLYLPAEKYDLDMNNWPSGQYTVNMVGDQFSATKLLLKL